MRKGEESNLFAWCKSDTNTIPRRSRRQLIRTGNEMHTLIRGWENVVCLVHDRLRNEKEKNTEIRGKRKIRTHRYVTYIIIIIIIVFAHVIVCQIGMIGLYTVVKY